MELNTFDSAEPAEEDGPETGDPGGEHKGESHGAG
jgi:hypothetical protein